MIVTFIAHAGVALSAEGTEICIDPWFFDSTREEPIIESLSGKSTIDFQVPRTKEDIATHTPRGIFVSHFHAHHAPKKDITLLASQGQEVIFGYPSLGAGNSLIQKYFHNSKQVTTLPFEHMQMTNIGPWVVTGLTHNVPGHIAWLIQSASGSVLHIADAHMNASSKKRELGPEWNAYAGLKPELLLLSAGGNFVRITKEEKPVLHLAGMSPVEAAQLVQLIQPKAVALIGVYNRSVWNGKSEFVRSSASVEEEFQWDVDWLAPHTKVLLLRPGHTIGIGNTRVASGVDFFIQNGKDMFDAESD